MPRSADRRVKSCRLPTVLPDSASTEHRVVLSLLFRLSFRAVERVPHGDPIERILFDTAVGLRHLEAGHVKNRRNDVGRMVILVPHLSLSLDAFGPVDDERIAGSAGELR